MPSAKTPRAVGRTGDGVTAAGTDAPEVVPARDFDVALLDLDGVVYVGPAAVPHAVEALTRAVAAGMRLAFVTNNASRPPREVADHLRSLGVVATPDDVVTSAQAGARLVADRVPRGSAVLAVGGPGVAAALVERGLRPVTADDADVTAVLQGYGPAVDWRALSEAGFALQRGVPWVATNTDLTIPTSRGIAPGNGALVALLARHTGRRPIVAGKPERPLVAESVERTAATRPLMVGDRLDTDIEGAVGAGLASLLVFTGVTGVLDVLVAPSAQRPTYLGIDLRDLHEPHRPPHRSGPEWRCGHASAVDDDGTLLVRVSRDAAPVDAVRCACSAAWAAADEGRPLDVQSAAEALQGIVDRARTG